MDLSIKSNGCSTYLSQTGVEMKPESVVKIIPSHINEVTMQAKEKILDDVARVAGGAISALGGLRKQIKDEVRVRIDELAQRLDLVPRDEFERMELMLLRAREEQNRLIERVAALEEKLAGVKTKQATQIKQKIRETKKARKK
jgi:BMFP domain-containing protein YqiC